MYFVFTFIGLIQSYNLSQAALAKDGLLLTVKNIVISGYNTIFLQVLVVAAITWVLTQAFTRPENILPPADDVEGDAHE